MSKVIPIAWRGLAVLSILAGILYNSWPLGFLLNPVVARNGLASELGGAGQPYNWVFIYGDVGASLIMLVVCWQLWVQSRETGHRRTVLVALCAMVVFCGGTSVAALYQVPCVGAVRQCPGFTHNPAALVHALTSVIAPVGLFVSLATLWWRRRANRLLAGQIVVYILLGSWTLMTLLTPGEGVVPQNVFITFCALCLAGFPWNFRQVYEPPLSRKSPGL